MAARRQARHLLAAKLAPHRGLHLSKMDENSRNVSLLTLEEKWMETERAIKLHNKIIQREIFARGELEIVRKQHQEAQNLLEESRLADIEQERKMQKEAQAERSVELATKEQLRKDKERETRQIDALQYARRNAEDIAAIESATRETYKELHQANSDKLKLEIIDQDLRNAQRLEEDKRRSEDEKRFNDLQERYEQLHKQFQDTQNRSMHAEEKILALKLEESRAIDETKRLQEQKAREEEQSTLREKTSQMQNELDKVEKLKLLAMDELENVKADQARQLAEQERNLLEKQQAMFEDQAKSLQEELDKVETRKKNALVALERTKKEQENLIQFDLQLQAQTEQDRLASIQEIEQHKAEQQQLLEQARLDALAEEEQQKARIDEQRKIMEKMKEEAMTELEKTRLEQEKIAALALQKQQEIEEQQETWRRNQEEKARALQEQQERLREEEEKLQMAVELRRQKLAEMVDEEEEIRDHLENLNAAVAIDGGKDQEALFSQIETLMKFDTDNYVRPPRYVDSPEIPDFDPMETPQFRQRLESFSELKQEIYAFVSPEPVSTSSPYQPPPPFTDSPNDSPATHRRNSQYVKPAFRPRRGSVAALLQKFKPDAGNNATTPSRLRSNSGSISRNNSDVSSVGRNNSDVSASSSYASVAPSQQTGKDVEKVSASISPASNTQSISNVKGKEDKAVPAVTIPKVKSFDNVTDIWKGFKKARQVEPEKEDEPIEANLSPMVHIELTPDQEEFVDLLHKHFPQATTVTHEQVKDMCILEAYLIPKWYIEGKDWIVSPEVYRVPNPQTKNFMTLRDRAESMDLDHVREINSASSDDENVYGNNQPIIEADEDAYMTMTHPRHQFGASGSPRSPINSNGADSIYGSDTMYGPATSGGETVDDIYGPTEVIDGNVYGVPVEGSLPLPPKPQHVYSNRQDSSESWKSVEDRLKDVIAAGKLPRKSVVAQDELYTVRITADHYSTDNFKLYLTMYGVNGGISPELVLEKEAKPFEPGEPLEYEFWTVNLGDLNKIKIVTHGLKQGTSWNLQKVVIVASHVADRLGKISRRYTHKDETVGKYVFECDQTFDVKSGLSHEFNVSSKKRPKRLSSVVKRFKNFHEKEVDDNNISYLHDSVRRRGSRDASLTSNSDPWWKHNNNAFRHGVRVNSEMDELPEEPTKTSGNDDEDDDNIYEVVEPLGRAQQQLIESDEDDLYEMPVLASQRLT